jgi:hypothetical protein
MNTLLSTLRESVSDEYKKHLETFGITGKDAKLEIKRLKDFYKNLQPEITLYRIVMVDDKKDIDYEHPGTHYSTSKKDLTDNYSFTTGSGKNAYMMTVKASKKQIDIPESISNNILYPNEQEITLKNQGKGVKIIKVTKITKN